MDDWDDERWRKEVADSFAAAHAAGANVDALAKATRYIQADVTDEGDLRKLLDASAGRVLIYFALPPSITEKACRALCAIGLPEGSRLVMEKPFGTGAESAQALNALVTQIVPEGHVRRGAHCLGMSTVRKGLGVGCANRIVEPVLNRDHVASVDVVFDETIGLEG